MGTMEGYKRYELGESAFRKEYLASRGGILLDARSEADYFEGTIPGAINLDYMDASFDRKIQMLDGTKKYYVFCRNGNRSRAAAKALRKKGYEAFYLKGGIGEWPFDQINLSQPDVQN